MSRRAYHFTHVDNLPGILGSGAVLCDSSVRQDGALARETANLDLKAKRRETPVPCAPGGVLADYVPFYFAPQSPMLLNLATGRVPHYQDGQDPLVFLVADVDRLRAAGAPIVVSDGHPVSPLTTFGDVVEMESRVDWAV